MRLDLLIRVWVVNIADVCLFSVYMDKHANKKQDIYFSLDFYVQGYVYDGEHCTAKASLHPEVVQSRPRLAIQVRT